MSIAIRISKITYDAAAKMAATECRTTALQVEYWAKIGKIALENPDLPIEFIKDILIARSQDRALAEPFTPEGKGKVHAKH